MGTHSTSKIWILSLFLLIYSACDRQQSQTSTGAGKVSDNNCASQCIKNHDEAKSLCNASAVFCSDNNASDCDGKQAACYDKAKSAEIACKEKC